MSANNVGQLSPNFCACKNLIVEKYFKNVDLSVILLKILILSLLAQSQEKRVLFNDYSSSYPHAAEC
jgi:hypothetical protein